MLYVLVALFILGVMAMATTKQHALSPHTKRVKLVKLPAKRGTLSNSVMQSQKYIKEQDHIVHLDELPFSPTLAGTSSSRRSRLICFVLHQSVIVVFTYVQMNQAKGRTSSCFGTSPVDPGVKALFLTSPKP